MKLLVEAAWALVIFGAFLAVLYTLRELGAGPNIIGGMVLGVFALVGLTCYTHWRD